MLLEKVSDWMKNFVLIILKENVFEYIVQSIDFYHNLVIWIIVTKNNLESEDFLKNVECNLTFLSSDKEYIFSDEMNEWDSYSTIVIDESSIEVREIWKTLNVLNVDQDELVDNNVYLRRIHLDFFNDDYQF